MRQKVRGSDGRKTFFSTFLPNRDGFDLAVQLPMAKIDLISGRIIGAAMRIHTRYGPGLLESVYTPCLGQELVAQGMDVEIEKPLGLRHEGLRIHRAYVLDLLVEDQVIVEVKCVAKVAPIHRAQLLTYLRLTGLQLGLIINFNVTRLIDGVHRVVNGYEPDERLESSRTGSSTATDFIRDARADRKKPNP